VEHQELSGGQLAGLRGVVEEDLYAELPGDPVSEGVDEGADRDGDAVESAGGAAGEDVGLVSFEGDLECVVTHLYGNPGGEQGAELSETGDRSAHDEGAEAWVGVDLGVGFVEPQAGVVLVNPVLIDGLRGGRSREDQDREDHGEDGHGQGGQECESRRVEFTYQRK